MPRVPWERNRIWIWDGTHFTRAKRVGYAIVDVVTRYWIGYLLTSEQTSTQAQLLFARAPEDQDLFDADRLPPAAEDRLPILVARSDNGTEMTATDTRQFMALMAITQHDGRPGIPTDQAHIESFFSHVTGDWPHLTRITDPVALDAQLAHVRGDYNTTRLHAAIGYVSPTMSITAAGQASAARAPPACAAPAPSGSSTVVPRSHDHRAEHLPRLPARASGGRTCLREGRSHGREPTGHGRSPKPRQPTSPTTSLNVGLKKSAAL